MIAALTKHGVGVMFDVVLSFMFRPAQWFQRAFAGEREYWVLLYSLR